MTGMERTREAFHLMTTNKVPKLRRKLQKTVSKSKRGDEPRRVVSDTYNSKTKSSKHHITTADISSPITATPPSLPPVTVTPGIREPEWSEYLWHSPPRSPPRRPERTPPRRQQQAEEITEPDSPVRIIPELSHLAISDTNSRASMSSGPTSPVLSQGGSPSRRRAKTPIFSIGQLDNIPRPRNALADEKRSSVAQIAEEYRALLESRNSSIFSHTRSDPTYSREQLRRQQTSCSRRAQSQPPISRTNTTSRRHHAGTTTTTHQHRKTNSESNPLIPPALSLAPSPRISSFPKPPTTSLLRPQASPRSDDGTLVSFDDGTVYFKPDFSTSPRPPSISDFPLPTATLTATPAPIVQKDLSLQICLDLLTRDLSTHLMPGLRHRRDRNSGTGLGKGGGKGGKGGEGMSTETAALQVWVMIEGYEKLREELLQEEGGGKENGGGLGGGREQREVVAKMLETWLKALYRIYDELSEEAFEGGDGRSESHYSYEEGYVSE
ncbi:hypothetical protein B0T20DRAFT_137042 [Sordaria brevicollis]|uniref:Mating-type switching protein swi10 n=1 Tax=Sordaria brevicollis TaxID=83679 RepID=A0AAE0UFP2_SORBR|nr:hypothetical protein B0T20DRAFT_137042 [Sordaria brevicollis]